MITSHNDRELKMKRGEENNEIIEAAMDEQDNKNETFFPSACRLVRE
jgi:hypothetical protein